MKIDLNKSFPIGKDGRQGPLPKQADFLKKTLDPKGPKFIAYVGGVGSGKSVIGCITILSQAVLYGGEYLICRQFMPELKATTYRTFLEICPSELIIENKIAEMTVYLKSASGKPALVMFRQLEDPDKLRSLNLSGFYIDEANQTTEEAFLLLQGRLRNHNGLRKGIITTNPKGHDWIYQYWVKQDGFSDQDVKKQFYLIKAPSTENVHLPEDYVANMLATYTKERIEREVMGSFDSFEGQVISEFRRDVHVVKPFVIPENWPRLVGIDYGYRNPHAWVWAAVDPDGCLYVYREFYEREWLVHEVLNGSSVYNKVGVFQRMASNEKIEAAAIDPSTRNRSGTKGESIYDEYTEHVPRDFPLVLANNDKTIGLNRLKHYFKIDTKIGKPMIYIFDTCQNLIEEIVKYRYQELNPRSVGKKADKEEPYKVDDHAIDALRYLVMLRPEPWAARDDAQTKLRKMSQIQLSLKETLDRSKGLQHKDPLDMV